MRGLPGHNHTAFNAAAEALRGAGHSVFNPAEIDGGSTDKPDAYYFKFDFRQLPDQEAICFIDGWQYSEGALIEGLTARKCGLMFCLYAPHRDEKVSMVDQLQIDEVLDRTFQPAKRHSAIAAHSPVQLDDHLVTTNVVEVVDEPDPRERINQAIEILESSDIRYYRIMAEIARLREAKGKDYGSKTDSYENIRVQASYFKEARDWQPAVAEAGSCHVRVKNFVQKGRLVHEPVRDSLLDGANYSLIALDLYDESQEGLSDS
jgi:hypothetical protein